MYLLDDMYLKSMRVYSSFSSMLWILELVLRSYTLGLNSRNVLVSFLRSLCVVFCMLFSILFYFTVLRYKELILNRISDTELKSLLFLFYANQ